MEGIVMRNSIKLAISTVMALSAATAALAPAAAKSDSSCYKAYGYYGYSSAYCEHSMYGRSTPADRYSAQNSGRVAEREQYSGEDPAYAVHDRGESKYYRDRDRDHRDSKNYDDRDRG
jgi:hypothetical protein